MQQMGGGAPIRLTRDAANEHQPGFSPDGTQIAFRSEKAGGGIYVIPALGGEARLVASLGENPRFSPDGREIAYCISSPTVSARSWSIHVVASTGDRARQLRSDFSAASYPVWAPDGKHLLFQGVREAGEAIDWWVTPLDDEPATKTGASESFQRRWPTAAWKGWSTPRPSAWFREQIIFADSSTDTSDLWWIPISNRTWKIAGKPRQLTSGTGHNIDGRVSTDGQVVFASLTRNFNLWGLPLDANRGRVTGGLERLTRGEAFHLEPSLSPDGRMLTFTATSPTKGEVILKDLATGKENSVFVVPRYGGYPDFSADGAKIAFASGATGEKPSIYVSRLPVAFPRWCARIAAWHLPFPRMERKYSTTRGLPRYIGLLEIATRQITQLLRNPSMNFFRAGFSR